MQIPLVLRASVCAALVLASARSAHAQTYEAVGTRAQSMGGAFVAVADDATATWWNPAGIATGAYFSAVFEHGRTTSPDKAPPTGPAARLGTNDFTAVFPAMGISYYRLRISQIRPVSSIAADGSNRQDLGDLRLDLRSTSVSQFGATFGQTIGGHLAVGTTLKLLRAGPASATKLPDGDALDAADDLPVSTSTRADLDLGIMVSTARVRIGASVKNLTNPQFTSEGGSVRLERQARAGVALLLPAAGGVDGVTVASDLDLTRTSTVSGEIKHWATGGEIWLGRRHVGVRGGLTRNMVGDGGPVTRSFGFSVSPLKGVFLDAARSVGADSSLRGWSASVRLTF